MHFRSSGPDQKPNPKGRTKSRNSQRVECSLDPLLEAQLCLATLVQHARLRVLATAVAPEPLVTLRPRGGLPARVERAASVPSKKPCYGGACSR